MDVPDIQPTDSGYPTPRDDIPSSSRSNSSSSPEPLTSTPIREKRSRPLREAFSDLQDLSIIQSANSTEISQAIGTSYSPPNFVSPSLAAVKSVLSLSKEINQKVKANDELVKENETLRGENESLREENMTLREESQRMEQLNASLRHDLPIIPKLQLDDSEKVLIPSGEKIKREPLSFFTNDEGKSLVESKNIFPADLKPKVFTATATIQVDTEKMDADVQTENADLVTEINANLRLELNELQSEIEEKNKKHSELQNRLFNYEQLKEKFEQDEKKLRADLEKKLKATQEKASKSEGKVEELELRLKKKREELEEMRAENKRLVEDGTTHDFEMDELKIQVQEEKKKNEENAKKMEELKVEINRLEKSLELEKEAKKEVEHELQKAKEDHERAEQALKQRIEEAVEKEAAASEKLNEIQEENRNILKENRYLSQAQQALLEKEINLKSEVSVIHANLRNTEQQVEVLKEKLEVEAKKRAEGDVEIQKLQLLNQDLDAEKRDSEELLGELKKGKVEIEHLREQLKSYSLNAADVAQLQSNNEELQRKIELIEQNEQRIVLEKSNFDKRVEEFIRSEATKEAEIERLRKDLEQSKTESRELEESLKGTVKSLEKRNMEYEALFVEFDQFRMDASNQYVEDVNEKDAEIEHLRKCLREAEDYPGKTISVSLKHAEVQTEDQNPPEDQSPRISILSVKEGPTELELLEKGVRDFQNIMKELPESLRSDTPSFTRIAKLILEIADILDVILIERTVPEERIRECWKNHLNLLEMAEVKMEQETAETKTKLLAELNVERTEWDEKVKTLKKEVKAGEKMCSALKAISKQLKNNAQSDEQNYVAVHDEYVKLGEYCNQLEQDLANAQHLLQEEKRSNSRRSDEFDEDLVALQNALRRAEANLDSKQKEIEKLEFVLKDVKKRREFDKESMESLTASLETVTRKNDYLRGRNTDRQKLLIHMEKVMHSVLKSIHPGSTKRALEELQHLLGNSRLIEMTQEEREETSHRRREV